MHGELCSGLLGHWLLTATCRWRYAELHNVQLPDEYDQIWSDLEPFWGMDPVDLNRLQLQHEGHIDSFTLGKNEGESIKLLNVSVSDPSHWEDKNLLRGAEDILDLLQDVQHHLPPFRAVVSPHDNPTLFSDFDSKSLALKAASKHSCKLSFWCGYRVTISRHMFRSQFEQHRT